MHRQTFTALEVYRKELSVNKKLAGAYLKKFLEDSSVNDLSTVEFLKRLLNTKKPQIYAESAVCGDGTDWNKKEMSLLGNISIAVPVTVFDEGQHQQPNVHFKTFNAHLVYTVGALLRNDKGFEPADWSVVKDDVVQMKALYKLYFFRLFPVFSYINETAAQLGKKAIVTMPGLGCGMFAGDFRGKMGAIVEQVVLRLLQEYAAQWPSIKLLYYDPYNECKNSDYQFDRLTFRVRPLLQNYPQNAQLSAVERLEEDGDDFKDTMLFSLVAWDHVSWPGNDFYLCSRATDDGVKAAATDSMYQMTGVKGCYHFEKTAYLPPHPYINWLDVVQKNKLKLKVDSLLNIYG